MPRTTLPAGRGRLDDEVAGWVRRLRFDERVAQVRRTAQRADGGQLRTERIAASPEDVAGRRSRSRRRRPRRAAGCPAALACARGRANARTRRSATPWSRSARWRTTASRFPECRCARSVSSRRGGVTERRAVQIGSGAAGACGAVAPGALRVEDALSGGDVARRGRGERSLLRGRRAAGAQQKEGAGARDELEPFHESTSVRSSRC